MVSLKAITKQCQPSVPVLKHSYETLAIGIGQPRLKQVHKEPKIVSITQTREVSLIGKSKQHTTDKPVEKI